MIWLAPADCALLRIDVQKTFCPAGRLPVQDGNAVVPVLNRMTPHFQLVIDSQDWHPKGHSSFASTHGRTPFDMIQMPYGEQVLWPDHAEQDSDDARFHPDLIPARHVIRKGTNPLIDSYSAFRENDRKTPPLIDGQPLAQFLRERGITRIVIGGLAFDYCVGFSALDAIEEGFEVIVVRDATRAIAMPTQTSDTASEMTAHLIAAGVRIVNEAELPQALGIPPGPRRPTMHP